MEILEMVKQVIGTLPFKNYAFVDSIWALKNRKYLLWKYLEK